MTVIDFVKILIIGLKLKSLKDHPAFEFFEMVNPKYGLVKQPNIKTAYYHSLKISIRADKAVMITGSLHNFWNAWKGNYSGTAKPKKKKGHNWNDFSVRDLWEVIDHLCQLFDLPPACFRLQNIEVGVNLSNCGIDPKEMIDSLILFGPLPWQDMRGNYEPKPHGKDAYFTRYGIKVYDKGKQYGRPEKITRYEMKVKKMIHLEAIGIESLAGLLSIDKMLALANLLIESVEKILFHIPKIGEMDLKPIDRKLWKKARHPTEWTDLKKLNSRSYYRKRERYRQFVNQYPDINPLPRLRSAIEKKVMELSSEAREKGYELTGIPDRLENGKGVQINTLSIGLKTLPKPPIDQGPAEVQPDRVCVACGRVLEGRQANCRTCSRKCRNAISNPRNNRRRKYGNELGLSLFPDQDSPGRPSTPGQPQHRSPAGKG
jgi:predicted nucleic acid-binding Zn ribbon protein